jgi:hypothetical protein
MDSERELIPLEQQTLNFYGKPIVVVRLPDGRPAVILNVLCDNLQIVTNSQVKRIRRTESIADDLVDVRVETEGGPQRMSALTLRAVPFWLAGIDPKRVREEIRPDIIRYQREVVDVLYAWAQSRKTLPSSAVVVPVEQNVQPIAPAQNASALAWAEYHQQMAAFYQWKAAVDTRIDALEERQGEMETRLDEHRRVLAFIPEILERLGPEKITEKHQLQVRAYVQQLSKATGKHSGTIYNDLYVAFSVPRYEDLLEEDWPQIEQWFKVQIERGKQK